MTLLRAHFHMRFYILKSGLPQNFALGNENRETQEVRENLPALQNNFYSSLKTRALKQRN